MKKLPSLKHLNLNLNDASGKEGVASNQVPTSAALPPEGAAGSAVAESVHVVDSRMPSKTWSVTRAGRLIRPRYVRLALKVAGASQVVIEETEASLHRHRKWLPVLVVLSDYGWLIENNRASSKPSSVTGADGLIQPQHVHQALRVAGATQEFINEAEATLHKDRNRLPVLIALSDYGLLIEEGVSELQFDKKVMPALMAALEGRSSVFAEMLMYVDDSVQEFLEDDDNREEYALSDEDVNALMVQLRGLDSLQRLALSRTVDAASDLRSESSMTAVDACRALGLSVN